MRVMPDPEDTTLRVLCSRESGGDYEPAQRDGENRYVVQMADGDWYEMTKTEAVQ